MEAAWKWEGPLSWWADQDSQGTDSGAVFEGGEKWSGWQGGEEILYEWGQGEKCGKGSVGETLCHTGIMGSQSQVTSGIMGSQGQVTSGIMGSQGQVKQRRDGSQWVKNKCWSGTFSFSPVSPFIWNVNLF